VSWNVCHILPKLDELKLYLENVDIMGISETFLNTDIVDNVVQIPNFSFVRKDRPNRAGGGLLVYISDRVTYKRRLDIEADNVESVWIQVCVPNHRPQLICFVYRVGTQPVEWYSLFERQLEIASGVTDEVFILGDMNLDYLKPKEINVIWKDGIVPTYNLKQLVNVPTRVTSESSTLIDHIYSSKDSLISELYVPEIALSDHYPVCCTIKTKSTSAGKGHKNIRYRSDRNFDMNLFLHDLNEIDWSLCNDNNVNKAISHFNINFLNVIKQHAPEKMKRVKYDAQPVWFTSEIKEAIKKRNKYKKKRDSENYRHWRNMVVSLIKKGKSNYYKHAIIESKGNSGKMWRYMNEITGKKRPRVPDTLQVGENLVTDQGEVVKQFNNQFANVAEKLLSGEPQVDFSPPDTLLEHVRSNVPLDVKFDIPQVHHSDISKALLQLDSKKATGVDDLPAKYLKMAAHVIAKPLSVIINKSISQGVFPDAWKLAQVSPIHKGGSFTDVENFRPISILPVLSKLIERHVHKAFYNFLSSYELLCKCQSGFRSCHSCATSLTQLVNEWYSALDSGNIVACLSVDLRRAFDVLSHNVLLEKLKLYGCSDLCLQWFKSYLSDRKQCVKVSNTKSDFSIMKYGVPQGSILGPLLFIVYVNDLSLAVPDVNVNMYADDSNFDTVQKTIAECERVLQENVFEISEWCTQNKLIINENKTKCMMICSEKRHRQLNDSTLNIVLDGSVLESVSSMKILGVTLDDSLHWRNHVDYVCTKISQMSGLLWRIKDCLTFETRKLFYYSYILPVFDYCLIVWGQCNKTLLDRLFRLQKRVARMVLNNYDLNEYELFKRLNWLPVYKRVAYQTVLMVFKSFHGLTPRYISDMFHFTGENYDYTLRTSGVNLQLPKPRTNMLKRSFSYSGAQLWNSLPTYIRESENVNDFKYKCKQYLLNSN
jgi:hypothetical protein